MHVISINIGKPVSLQIQNKVIPTSIYKSSIGLNRIQLTYMNLEGDVQADLVYHGGVDKALCVYSYDHYPYWQSRFEKEMPYGAFGENLTVADMKESDVCIGDVFQIGEAIVQVSQPRQPCYKL